MFLLIPRARIKHRIVNYGAVIYQQLFSLFSWKGVDDVSSSHGDGNTGMYFSGRRTCLRRFEAGKNDLSGNSTAAVRAGT
jgi:hypothetical protein